MAIFRYSVDSSAGCCHHDEIVLRLLYNFLLLLFFNLKTLHECQISISTVKSVNCCFVGTLLSIHCVLIFY